jgi:hypothetical protein
MTPDWIKTLVRQKGAWANIPPKRNRREAIRVWLRAYEFTP